MITTFKCATERALQEIHLEMQARNTSEVFVLFAMGSQFDHLIKLALEKIEVYCLVADPASVKDQDIRALRPKGIIISGGPASVHSDPPPFDECIFSLGIPVLGICLGFQMWAKAAGASVVRAEKREFGIRKVAICEGRGSPLLDSFPSEFDALQNHGDHVLAYPTLDVLALSANGSIAAAQCMHLSGVQFHPEVRECEHLKLFENFCFGICGAKDRFPAEDIAAKKTGMLRRELGNEKIILALSGGCDSSVAAYLIRDAIGQESRGKVRAVYIKGIDNPEDEAGVRKSFGSLPWLDLAVIDATDRFLAAFKGVESGSGKRSAMRGVYKSVLEEEGKKFGATVIIQGTLYTDLTESGAGHVSGAQKATIKQHHNVNLGFSMREVMPFADCFKDHVRSIGKQIGVPEELMYKHPFPGPGLSVMIEGEIDAENLGIARKVYGIFEGELRAWNLYHTVWQSGVFITRSTHSCSKGDGADSGIVVILWAVWSTTGFTARRARFPDDFIDLVSDRITDEIREVGCVCMRISGKPPTNIVPY